MSSCIESRAHFHWCRHPSCASFPLHVQVENKVAIAGAGGISPTVSLLATGGPRAQEHAAHALASLGLDNIDNQRQISTLLVGLLGSGMPEAKSNAATSLWRLVRENAGSRDEVAKAGPTSDLIALLKEGTKEAKAYALWSLSLSINEHNQKTILDEDGVEPLVKGLKSPVQITRQQAAAAIAALVLNNTKAQTAIAAKGGIAPLIKLITLSPAYIAAAEAVDREAAHASAEATASVQPSEPNEQESVAAEASAGPPSSSAPATAAMATEPFPARLSPLRGQRRKSVGSAAALDLAAQVVTEEDGMEAKQYAAAALSDLAIVGTNRDEIVEKGGIAPLVVLLKYAEDMGKKFAAAALARLADGHQQTAADIAKAGAIPWLVGLLGGEHGTEAQEEAAGALFSLADDNGNRVAITEAGGIGPMVELLGSSNSRVREPCRRPRALERSPYTPRSHPALPLRIPPRPHSRRVRLADRVRCRCAVSRAPCAERLLAPCAHAGAPARRGGARAALYRERQPRAHHQEACRDAV